MNLLSAIRALVVGGVVGALATLSHAALFPLGLLIALAGSFAALRLLALRSRTRWASFIALIGWVVVVYPASIAGGEGELLIWNTPAGNLFLVGGLLAVLTPLLFPVKKSAPADEAA
jgi:hypothetical protein